MSAFSALRSFTFFSLILCGLSTAAWSGVRHVPWAQDQYRGDVVWIDTAHG